MATILKVCFQIENPARLHQSMQNYLKNTPAKFRKDPIWNYRTLVFLDQVEELSPQQEH